MIKMQLWTGDRSAASDIREPPNVTAAAELLIGAILEANAQNAALIIEVTVIP